MSALCEGDAYSFSIQFLMHVADSGMWWCRMLFVELKKRYYSVGMPTLWRRFCQSCKSGSMVPFLYGWLSSIWLVSLWRILCFSEYHILLFMIFVTFVEIVQVVINHVLKPCFSYLMDCSSMVTNIRLSRWAHQFRREAHCRLLCNDLDFWAFRIGSCKVMNAESSL